MFPRIPATYCRRGRAVRYWFCWSAWARAGSGTPAMTAVAEPDIGLAAASGSLAIPALKAGQNAVVRVPSVTAGADPTGMFRLRLNAQDDQKQVAPDRPGGQDWVFPADRRTFAKITDVCQFPRGRVDFRKARGQHADRDGDSTLAEYHALEWLCRGRRGVFPGRARIALSLVDPQKKTGRNRDHRQQACGRIQALPAGTQFLRWLGKDEVLLKGADHLIRHPLGGGEDHVFEAPAAGSGRRSAAM